MADVDRAAEHAAKEAERPEPEEAKLYALLASGKGVYAFNLSKLEHRKEQRVFLNDIKEEIQDEPERAELFLIGASGLLYPATPERTAETVPLIFFTARRTLDLEARKALLHAFNAVHSGVEAFSHTPPADPQYRAQRFGWALAFKSLPFVQAERLGKETGLEFELSYAKRTGPLESDVSLGLDLNYRLLVKHDPVRASLVFQADSDCLGGCTQRPFCPHDPEPVPRKSKKAVQTA